MKYEKTTLSKISNTLFLIIAIFLFFYIWSVNSIKNIKVSIIVSTVITSVCAGIILYLNLKKEKNLNTLKATKAILDKCHINLFLGNNTQIMALFKEIFVNHKYKNNIFYSKNNYKILLFDKETIEIDDLIPYIKSYKNKDITFLTLNYEENILPYLKKYNITLSLLNLKDIYKLYFKPLALYPDFGISSKTNVNIKVILKNALSKKRAKNYFITSLVMLLYTMYLPYKTLYLILASALLLLCITTLFLNTKNT